MNATALFNTLLSTSPICLIPSETAASGCSFGVHNPRIVALTVGLTSLVLILLSFGQSQDESTSNDILVVGNDGVIGLIIGTLKAIRGMRTFLRTGYQKARDGVFKMPMVGNWHTILNSLDLVEELSKVPEETMSLHEYMSQALAAEYTFSSGTYPFIDIATFTHRVIQGPITKNIGLIVPDIVDEIAASFEENIPGNSETEWTSLPALDTIMKVVKAGTYRMMFGVTPSRDKKFGDLTSRMMLETMILAYVLTMIPKFMKRPVTNVIHYFQSTRRKINEYLNREIQERVKSVEVDGLKYSQLPFDAITCAVEQAHIENKSLDFIIPTLLVMSLASVHTISMTFTDALLHLATDNRQHLEALREEAAEAVRIHGWTKKALDSMNQADSFIKECLRIDSVTMVAPNRKVMKDYTFSNGLAIHPGEFVGGNTDQIHRDDRWYPNASSFDGFRFVGKTGAGMVNTSSTFLTFGHGRQSCPGRWFAAALLKAIMAHLVLNYEFKLDVPDPSKYPTDFPFNNENGSKMKAKVLFKKRTSSGT